VDVTLQVGEGMVHVWQAFARILPEARPFIDHVGRFVRRQAEVGAQVSRRSEAAAPGPRAAGDAR
jgi:hypothetical protein